MCKPWAPSTILRISPSLVRNGTEETETGFDWEANPFYEHGYIRRERRRSVSLDPLRAAAISLQNHEFSRRAARRLSIFRKPRTRATFASPEYCRFARIISNVKHCNLNMDKARRVRAVSRYQSKCVHVCISPRGIMYTFTVIGRLESSMLQKSEIWKFEIESDLPNGENAFSFFDIMQNFRNFFTLNNIKQF